MVTDGPRCWVKNNGNLYNFVVKQLLFYHVAYRAVIMHSAADLLKDAKITFFVFFLAQPQPKFTKPLLKQTFKDFCTDTLWYGGDKRIPFCFNASKRLIE